MNRMERFREMVDSLDEQMLVLLVRRARLVRQIGQIKGTDQPVRDPEREGEILQRIERMSPPDLKPFLVPLYSLIISHFREYEEEEVLSLGSRGP